MLDYTYWLVYNHHFITVDITLVRFVLHCLASARIDASWLANSYRCFVYRLTCMTWQEISVVFCLKHVILALNHFLIFLWCTNLGNSKLARFCSWRNISEGLLEFLRRGTFEREIIVCRWVLLVSLVIMNCLLIWVITCQLLTSPLFHIKSLLLLVTKALVRRLHTSIALLMRN